MGLQGSEVRILSPRPIYEKGHYEVAFFVPVTKVPASRVSLMLMEQAGILTPQESEEISQLLAG
jgi:hypothetical protein